MDECVLECGSGSAGEIPKDTFMLLPASSKLWRQFSVERSEHSFGTSSVAGELLLEQHATPRLVVVVASAVLVPPSNGAPRRGQRFGVRKTTSAHTPVRACVRACTGMHVASTTTMMTMTTPTTAAFMCTTASASWLLLLLELLELLVHGTMTRALVTVP